MSQLPPIKFQITQLTNDLLDMHICVTGWIRSARSQKGVSFLSINDGSCHECLQVVADTLPDDCATGASVKVTGLLVVSPAKGQHWELKATKIEVIGIIHDAAHYPLAKKRLPLEHVRTFPHLRPRTNTFGAIARIRNTCIRATHDFYQEKGFLNIHTPLITSSDCEGAGEAFHVMDAGELRDHKIPPAGWMKAVPTGDKKRSSRFECEEPNGKFFRKDAYLTVSGQLQVETYACAMGDVYTFGPTFRAEKSSTSRHLAEFWMIEPEMVHINMVELTGMAEAYVKHCVQAVLASHQKDLEFLQKYYDPELIARLDTIANKPFFYQILYTHAIDLLKLSPFGGEWGEDLSSDQEKWLLEKMGNGGPVIVTHYPKSIKPFYMKANQDGKTVDCFDLLVPGIGELIGGSMREDDYDILKTAITKAGLDPALYDWYLDLRKYGSVPHGGFGLGFERLVMLVTGMKNIRDVIPFPVAYGRLD